ncbi:hypothetical protein [Vibrio phage vB_VmeM-Yong XC32]|nr:hypothetical protein [Vibrio phage vB_VmeM-Yong XC31]QAX96311.1 hypothetical protein [Vibrio phage vB_VmeM-Yong XC32]QAX96629.1 hypothetical protein [Vibrio phage vB_VmeM-Yong MS31]QAX96947.1 hypothetical protein [Vibrio phage vB_VmeM-Yong MS32]
MSQAYTSVKTIYGAALEASRRPGNSFTPLQHSTLNEHFNIEFGTSYPADAQPEVQYLAIGRGGHRNVPGGSGESLTDNLQHQIVNACLFDHLPFLLVPVGSDISSSERDKYRLRRVENHGGSDYIAYYLKKIDQAVSTPVIKELTITDGNITEDVYTPTTTQLQPTPVSMTNGIVNTATGKHIAIDTPFPVVLSSDDVSKILDAVNIIYSDARYAVISEIGIVSAIDANVTAASDGVNYVEALAAQIYNHIGTNIPLAQQQQGVTMNFTIGTSMPWVQ